MKIKNSLRILIYISKYKKLKTIIFFFFIIILTSFLNYDLFTQEWTKYLFNPVVGNDITGTVFDPFVLKVKNTYKMYVSLRNKGAIVISESNDGIIWSDLKIVLSKGDLNSWDYIVNRACVLFKEGKYYMWYTGQYKETSKIGFATSNNGYNFTKLQEPVLFPEYKFEKKNVMNPHVIYDEYQKIYKMWYSAGEFIEPDSIGYAISHDGIKWVKYRYNPIFVPRKDVAFLDNFKIGGCFVLKISNNKYLMFYIGYTDLNTARIFIAMSPNGINNWKRSKNPIIKPSKGSFDGDSCYKPSVIYNKKLNKWILYYNGRKKDKEYIGYAIYNKFNLLDQQFS